MRRRWSRPSRLGTGLQRSDDGHMGGIYMYGDGAQNCDISKLIK